MPTHTFKELRDEFTARPENAALLVEVKEERARTQAAYEASLAEVRRARAFTQEQLAHSLNVSQAQVARIERQADLYLSTLRTFLAALGARLELTATFDDARVTFSLSDLALPTELDDEAAAMGDRGAELTTGPTSPRVVAPVEA